MRICYSPVYQGYQATPRGVLQILAQSRFWIASDARSSLARLVKMRSPTLYSAEYDRDQFHQFIHRIGFLQKTCHIFPGKMPHRLGFAIAR